jgi:AraC family transcriptional regulator
MNAIYGAIAVSEPARAPTERAGYLVQQALTFLHTDRRFAQRCLNDAVALLGTDAIERNANTSAVHPCRSGLARWQARRVLAYIDGNLESKLTIGQLAGQVSLSDSHFSRAFKQALGSPPIVYITAKRIERAKAMMSSTVQPLCAIALACGFTDQPHFNRAFRRRVGMSPGTWRRAEVSLA